MGHTRNTSTRSFSPSHTIFCIPLPLSYHKTYCLPTVAVVRNSYMAYNDSKVMHAFLLGMPIPTTNEVVVGWFSSPFLGDWSLAKDPYRASPNNSSSSLSYETNSSLIHVSPTHPLPTPQSLVTATTLSGNNVGTKGLALFLANKGFSIIFELTTPLSCNIIG